MKRATITLTLPLLFLAACGGGSSDSGGITNPPPRAGFPITATNGLQVAQVTYQAAAASGEIAGLAGNTGLTGNSGGGLSKPGMAQQPAGAIGALLQKVPIPPTTLPCAISGTVTVSGNLADPSTVTAGDTLTIEYDNCDDGVGETLDGTLDTLIDAITGDVLSGIYEMTMSMDLINFQSTTATEVYMANGDATATINTLTPMYVAASVSGNSLLTDTNNSTETLTNFATAQTVDVSMSPSPFTLTASGTLDSSQLDGAVTYSTPVMLEGEDANYPNAGELLVVGEGSSARVIAQANGVDVVIEIYSNTTGTGTPDETIMTTWTELAGV
jgi:hypothetical protein